jgi:hypothetical protein
MSAQVELADSNVAGIGSDADKAQREAAAKMEGLCATRSRDLNCYKIQSSQTQPHPLYHLTSTCIQFLTSLSFTVDWAGAGSKPGLEIWRVENTRSKGHRLRKIIAQRQRSSRK